MLHDEHGCDAGEKQMRGDADDQKFPAGPFPFPPTREDSVRLRWSRFRLVEGAAHSSSFTVNVTLSIFATASASSTSMVRLYFACSSLTIVTTAGVFAASAFCFNRI